MKEQLCAAFCDELSVSPVPLGFAVATAFVSPDGDRVGFYVARDRSSGAWSLRDRGTVWPALEATGFSRATKSRASAFAALLEDHGVDLDEESRAFVIHGLTENDVPAAALRFVSFCLRVWDLALMAETRVASTFREDVQRRLTEVIADRAQILERSPVLPALDDFLPDFVIRAPSMPPLGLFLGTTDARVMEALYVQMRAKHELEQDCKIVALLEGGKSSVSAKVHQQAANRLDALPEFRGDELEAARKIAALALSATPTVH